MKLAERWRAARICFRVARTDGVSARLVMAKACCGTNAAKAKVVAGKSANDFRMISVFVFMFWFCLFGFGLQLLHPLHPAANTGTYLLRQNTAMTDTAVPSTINTIGMWTTAGCSGLGMKFIMIWGCGSRGNYLMSS